MAENEKTPCKDCQNPSWGRKCRQCYTQQKGVRVSQMKPTRKQDNEVKKI